jgi:Arylsulfotransferase (ASST)
VRPARVLLIAALGTTAAGCGSTATKPPATLAFKSRPDLTPPVVRVHVARSTASAGFIFIAPKAGAAQKGPEIVDGAGQPVWFDPVPGQATEFRVQTYRGRRVLTWWQGPPDAPVPGSGRGHDMIMDRSYRLIATVDAGFGHNTADLHEFQLTPRGTALITAYRVLPYDLTGFGGPKRGKVADSIIREVHVATGRVLFTWHALEHVALSETYASVPKATAKRGKSVWDYFHINSVQEELNGNLLVSARNTWAVYEISHTTGKVLWRLGGKRSTFRLGPSASFAWQHDARRRPDGTITILDNESGAGSEQPPRVISLRLDPQWKIATLVHADVAPKGVLSGSQGNAQLLQNGHVLVGWGSVPRVTEFDASGNVVFDATFTRGDDSYRAYRFTWSAAPSSRPAIAVEAPTSGRRTVYASWNGATAVASWRVVAGAVGEHLRPVATARKTGFETRIGVSTKEKLFAVEALDASGRVLATSAAVPPGAAAQG